MNPSFVFACLVALSGLGLCTPARADAPTPRAAIQNFQPYEPSYVLMNHSQRDQNALRAHLSMRYLFWNSGELKWVDEVFGSYNGEFDFYAFTRRSSPVVGRMHNPAMHLRWNDAHTFVGPMRWVDAAFEHRSNGQVGEFDSAQARSDAQRAYDQGDYAYFDSVSHSTNYFSLEAQSQPQSLGALGPVAFNAKAKMYVTKDTDVLWGPLRPSGVSISDYDRVSLRAMFRDGYALELVAGDKGLSTASLNLDWAFEVWHLPLYIRAHVGPMNTLSDYTRSQSAIGVGLRFCGWSVQARPCQSRDPR